MRYKKLVHLGLQYSALFAFWFMLSGYYQAKFLALGAAAVAVVFFLNRDIFRVGSVDERRSVSPAIPVAGWRWLSYLVWLLYNILIANVQVAYLVLHPRMPISPVLLRFRVPWRNATAQVVLANSITLTPGTITVDLQDGQYVVHTLTPSMAHLLTLGKTQKRVATIFGEEAGEAPSVSWSDSIASIEP